MIKQFFLAMLVCIVSLSQTGCGLSIVQDWQASSGKAIIGGGAVAGKDYVNGLKPSENARKYFAKISANGDSPIETVRRTDDSPSKTGVRFVKNGGILIPPGVTISFTNKGYCMDPHLPAPKAGEEFQLVPITQLIPEDLQGIYKKLLTKASSGDPSVQRNMQHLVWALRTAGTDAAFANNLTPQQKRILDRCSEYPGQFEEFNANAKANSKALKELIGLADLFANIKIGGVSYKASDLLDPDIGNKKINEHLNQLIEMGKHMPVEKSGFNFGEIQSGIYTDVRGTGYMKYRAKIANSTNQPFIFYPTDYAGQVGSPTKNGAVATYAAANTTMKQRMTFGNPDDVKVEDEKKPCEHIWKILSSGKILSTPNKDEFERRRNYRKTLQNEIAGKRAEITNIIKNLQRQNGMEYGAIIYEKDGKVYATEVTSGNWDYSVIRTSGFFKSEQVYRSTERDGKFYQYDDLNTGSFDRNNPMNTPYENYHEPSLLSLSTDSKYRQASWSLDFSKIPEGATILEYSHMHPGENGFSCMDLYLAEKYGINATVINPPDFRDTTYNPDTELFSSKSNSNDDFERAYNGILKEKKKKYSYICIKCGATK